MSGETPGERLTWRLVVPLLLGPAINPLNTTMIAVGLAPIAAALDVEPGAAVALIAALYLTSAIAQPTMGALADSFGPRRVYRFGLIFVLAAGVLPWIFPTFWAALLARIFVGIGSSAAYPSVMTMVRQRSQRTGAPPPPLLLSGISMSALVTSWVGPPLGGLVIALVGWQGVFIVNLPLAAAALLFSFGLPRDPRSVALGGRPRALSSLDPLGMLLFAAALTPTMIVLLNFRSGWWWLLAGGLVAAVVLVWWERRHPRPFFDVRMLAASPSLARTYARIFLASASAYLVMYAFSPWLQDAVGLDPAAAGLAQVPGAVLAALASIAVARTTRIRTPLVIGAIVMLAGGAGLVLISSAAPLWVILMVGALFGVPQALASISNQAVLYRQAPPAQIGNAAGLSRTGAYVGGMCASSVIGIVFAETVSDAGMHVIGVVVAVAALVSLALSSLDPAVRGQRPAA